MSIGNFCAAATLTRTLCQVTFGRKNEKFQAAFLMCALHAQIAQSSQKLLVDYSRLHRDQQLMEFWG